MKLPSINYLISNAKESFKRFPITIISSFIAVSVSVFFIEYDDDLDNAFPYINLLLAAALGVPLYFNIAIYCQVSQGC